MQIRSVGIGFVFTIVAALDGQAVVVAEPCACNSNVDNNDFVNAIDIDIVKNCVTGVNCGLCVNSCDVDCDGDIDYYDAGVVACAHQGQSNCCSEPDGACTGANATPACVLTTDNYCSVASGTWHGANTICSGNEVIEIPAASTWGLIAMTISLLAVATIVLQRRAPVIAPQGRHI